MSTITLLLSDEIESKLAARANSECRDVEAVALEILEAGLALNKQLPLKGDEWRREFDAWIKSRPRIDVVLDDSRETIYEGR